MKKDAWLPYLAWFLIIVLDQASKSIFMNSDMARFNEGFIFGSFSQLPVAIRIITMSSLYGFIFFTFVCLNYLISSKFSQIKYSLALLVGGVGGNVFDRTFRGKTLDFIPLHLGESLHFTFNLADFFQWLGATLIIFYLFKFGELLWPNDNQRGKYVINPREQLRFAFKMALVALCSCLLLGIFSYVYWRIFLQTQNLESTQFLSNYLVVFVSLSFSFTIFAFIAGVVLSHKSVGPLYAFELYIEDLLRGEDRQLTLREGDHYKHLEQIAKNLREALKK